MRREDWIATAVLVCVLSLGVVFFVPWAEANQREEDNETRFEGACLYLTGTVKDDVCVKDNEVVLTKEEFTALLP